MYCPQCGYFKDVSFKMQISLNDKYMKKLFDLHDLIGGSDTDIGNLVESALMRGIDALIHEKGGKDE